MKRALRNPAATETLGAGLARTLADAGAVIYLEGQLGAGKTTLVRGLLRGLGYAGRVKSPTYTLVEPYEINGRQVFHLDLYRLGRPEELEFLGVRELDVPGQIVLIEWPERGIGLLPTADLQLRLDFAGEGRVADLRGRTSCGAAMLEALPDTSL